MANDRAHNINRLNKFIITKLSNTTKCDGFPITEDIDRFKDLMLDLGKIIQEYPVFQMLTSIHANALSPKTLLRKIKENPTEANRKMLTEMGKAIINYDMCRPSEVNAFLGINLPAEESDSGDY